jgi:Synergist-CTERM protein sorting domain-containing protein
LDPLFAVTLWNPERNRFFRKGWRDPESYRSGGPEKEEKIMRISEMRGAGRPAAFLVLGLLLSLSLVLGSSGFSEGTTTILRVTPEGAGTRDGSSWANALGEAEFISSLASAFSGTEFWLAKGSYRPAIPADSADITETERAAVFTLAHRVKIYGGFAGTETERSRRDWTVNVTVLTGDLGNDDLSKVNGATTDYSKIVGTNSATVVRADSTVDETAVLDGVTVCGGSAEDSGGGLYNQGVPTVEHCIFSGNLALNGGGMYNGNNQPVLTNCTFSGNGSNFGRGGGMFNDNWSLITLTDCTFSDNRGLEGGGMANENCSQIILGGCTFSGNVATLLGGGGLYGERSLVTATNCTVSSNRARFGAGLFLRSSYIVLINCTSIENDESEGGIVEGDEGATLSARNCIFWNEEEQEFEGFNSASDSVTYSVVKDGRTGAGNLTVDPELKALADNGGSTLTHALSLGSCAVDTGTSADVPSEDQRGVSRPKGAGYDMGAYELDPSGDSVLTPTVTPSSASPSVTASSAGGGGCSVGLVAPMLIFSLVPLLLRRRR